MDANVPVTLDGGSEGGGDADAAIRPYCDPSDPARRDTAGRRFCRDFDTSITDWETKEPGSSIFTHVTDDGRTLPGALDVMTGAFSAAGEYFDKGWIRQSFGTETLGKRWTLHFALRMIAAPDTFEVIPVRLLFANLNVYVTVTQSGLKLFGAVYGFCGDTGPCVSYGETGTRAIARDVWTDVTVSIEPKAGTSDWHIVTTLDGVPDVETTLPTQFVPDSTYQPRLVWVGVPLVRPLTSPLHMRIDDLSIDMTPP